MPTELELRRSRRRYSGGCIGGSGLAIAAFAWMITGGTWNFFQSGLNTEFYDVQARALLAGHWNMPPKVLAIEGIIEHHKAYMYYGPVPAILRMPVLLLTHRLDGRLTEVSMLLAFVVALTFTARLGWKIRCLVASDRLVSRTEAVIAAAVMVMVGVGSNLFFLASDPFIYHEAEIWGAAFALGSFDFLLGFLVKGRPFSAMFASLFATLAMLTRGSVGAGPVAALGLTALAWILTSAPPQLGGRHVASWLGLRLGYRARPAAAVGTGAAEDSTGPETVSAELAGAETGSAELAGAETAPPAALPTPSLVVGALLLACVLAPVLSYAIINEIKFGTLFSLPLDKQVDTLINAHRRAVLKANGGSLFGLKFVPTALVAYFGLDAVKFTRIFPWVMFPNAAHVIGHVLYDDRDWASSIPVTMPALALTGLIGIVGVFLPARRRGRRSSAPAPVLPKERALRIPILGAAVGTAGVLTIAFIANRYLADFMPLAILCALAGVHLTVRFFRKTRAVWRVAPALALPLVALAGLWSNLGLSLVYQRELRPAVPLAMRAGFVSFQQHLDESLFGNPAQHVVRVRGTSLPPPAPAGTLVIVGSCTALYESAGVGSGWDAVERSEAGGHYRLLIHFPSRASPHWWPILANGKPHAAAYLALRSPSNGEYQFGYYFQASGQSFVLGSTFSEPPGTHVVDAVLDPLVQEVTVTVDGNTEFELGYFVRSIQRIYVGANPLGGPVATRYPSRVVQLKVTTPICNFVERRLPNAR
ncbi:MAG: hypothetical protein ACLPQS_10590 [Acidimicrobiales bacterium]